MAEQAKLDPALRKRKITLYTLAEIVAIFAITLLGNCWDWLHFAFDFSNIRSGQYWSSVAVQAAMYSLSLIVGYLGKLEKLVLTDDEFHRDLDQYHDRWKMKSQSFPVWIDGTKNPQIQLDFYREHIRDRLGRLDRWARDIDKNQYLRWLDSKLDLESFQFPDKRAVRYAKKRFAMEQLITPNNIEKNAQSYSRYPRLHAYSFTWGIRDSHGRENEYKVNNTVGFDLSVILAKKFMEVMIAGLFVASIFINPDAAELGNSVLSWIAIIVKYLIRCATIAICLTQGLFLAKRIFDVDYIMVIENRTNILNEYISWDIVNGNKDDPVRKIMDYLSNQQAMRDEAARAAPNRESNPQSPS